MLKHFALRLQSYVLVHWAIAALSFKMYKQRKREKRTHTDKHTHNACACVHYYAGVALMSVSAAALGVSSPPPSPAPPPFSALTSPSAVLLGKNNGAGGDEGK